jgi:hypothetical protein
VIRSGGLVVVLLLLGGCGRAEYIKDLGPARDTAKHFVLVRDTTYSVSRGIGVQWTEGLHAGTYVPELENEFGTFYRGPGKCAIQYMGSAAMGDYAGGLWIPKDPKASSPMVYYYFAPPADAMKSGPSAEKAVAESFMAGQAGKIGFMGAFSEDHGALNDIRPAE